jgi:hypothetical protein
MYVRRSGLIVAGKHISPARLSFPTTVFDNLEVHSAEQFINLISEFLKEQDMHGKRILVVLDETAVFEKTVEIDKSGKPDKIMAAYVAAMPFQPGQRICIGVNDNSSLHLYATNAHLADCLSQAIKLSGAGRLLAITPAAAYGLADDQPLSSAVTTFITDSSVRSRANLASVSPV